jgi:hypothetical protein
VNDLDWGTLEGEIVLVGNGPVQQDCNDRVSRADHVFRFNFARADQENSGTRTDYLVINNVGKPAMRMLALGLPSLAAGAHIVFGRSVETHLEYYERCNLKRIPQCLVSTEQAMIKHLAIERFSRMSPEHCAAAFECLKAVNGRYDFAMPSIGFQTFHCLIENAPKARITLIGYTFEGWYGHHWRKERMVVESSVESGRAEFLV